MGTSLCFSVVKHYRVERDLCALSGNRLHDLLQATPPAFLLE